MIVCTVFVFGMGGFGMVIKLTLHGDSVAAGFPSPAEDYKEDAMQGLGIFDQDLLIVDRSLTPRSSQVLPAGDGERCCKQIDVEGRQLLSANEHYPPIAKALRALSYSEGMLGGGIICVLNIFIISAMFYSFIEYIQHL
ncbi:MAG: DNA polymerase V [Oleispira sp.]